MCEERVDWVKAFAEEIPIIKARRYGTADAPDEDVRNNLAGLAISGGGIRSATFALGVLEGLRLLGLLSRIDYLSTVSGGGYIGAWLSANCQRAPEGKSWLTMASDWKLSVDHLRRYSNYLSPTVGFFSADTWSMVAIWLRNTLLVQLTVILAIALALLLPRPLYEAFGYWPYVGYWRWITIALFVMGAAGIAGNHLRLSSKRGADFLTDRRWLQGLIPAMALLGTAVWLGVVNHFDPFSNEAIGLFPAIPIAFLSISGGFCLQPVAVKLINLCWRGSDPPKQVNFNQAWVQGIVVMPMMIVGFLVGAILWGDSQPSISKLAESSTFSSFFADGWHYWPFPLALVFASLWLFSFCAVWSRTDKWCLLAALAAPLPAMLTLHALLSAIMVLLHVWARQGAMGSWLAYISAPPLVLYSFSLTIVMLIGMLGRQSKEGVREWWSRFGAWLIIYGLAWLIISAAAAFGPLLSAFLFQGNTWRLGASISTGWAGTTLAGLLAGKSDSTGKTTVKSTKESVLDFIARVAPFIFIAGLLVAISTVLELVLSGDSNLHGGTPVVLASYQWKLLATLGEVLLGCTIALLTLAARVDINEFSLNAFYRSRLIRCYLGATRFKKGERNPQHFTGFDDGDDMPLASMQPAETAVSPGPFHIVNCALNLGGSKDLALHTRHSAIFTLTSLRCGSGYRSGDQSGNSEEIGYSKTAEFGGANGQPTLGLAIAASGAAASPNMGYHTSPVVAFVMTLFNVRLGWWFPNPKSEAISHPSPWFSLRYLFTELFGGANDKSKYVAISDGGHFENMGAYELIKRKCRLIIISDAECDPALTFEGLGTLIRMCDVDFGVKISIDVNSTRTGDSGWSSRRCAIGSIDYGAYGNHFQGTLVYLKASMTGREETDILQYKSGHPAFPHESTDNQFYSEDQFESYRNLGRDIAMRTFESVSADSDFIAMADELRDIWAPVLPDTKRFTRHGTQLAALWSKLSQSKDLHSLDPQFTRDWPKVPAPEFRSSFYLCCEMIQLMENTYLELGLEDHWEHADNAGLRTTFKQWANAAAIQETWQLTSGNYGLRFRYFWNRRLQPEMKKSASQGF
jgi:hypothetical protein